MADSAASRRLVSELGIAPVVDTDSLENAEMRKGKRLGGALLVEAVSAVSAVMFPVGKGEGGPAPHADVGIHPFGGLKGIKKSSALHHKRDANRRQAYRTAVYHAARDGDARGKLEALALQGLVDLPNVSEFVAAFGGGGPGLDELEDLGADLGVDADGADGFEERHQALHELAGGDLGEEMGTAILDAGVGELGRLVTVCHDQTGAGRMRRGAQPYVQSTELGVGVLVADALLERAHGLLGLDRLGSDNVGDLEVEGDVFAVVGKHSQLGLHRELGRGGDGHRTGCCQSLCRSAHPGPCWPRTTTTPSL